MGFDRVSVLDAASKVGFHTDPASYVHIFRPVRVLICFPSSLILLSSNALLSQDALMHLMRSDSLRRFRESSLYSQFLAKEPLPLSATHADVQLDMSSTALSLASGLASERTIESQRVTWLVMRANLYSEEANVTCDVVM